MNEEKERKIAAKYDKYGRRISTQKDLDKGINRITKRPSFFYKYKGEIAMILGFGIFMIVIILMIVDAIVKGIL